jgi:hypothetical protein
MGMIDIALPAANTRYNGNTSPITPYIIADKAEPPTEAEEIKPIIAPLFFSGSASISDALNMALPAVLRKAPMKANMHIVTNSDCHIIKEKVREELSEHGISHATLELETVGEHCHENDCNAHLNVNSGHAHHHHHH